jgi:very-short-patch-repair endonuclease
MRINNLHVLRQRRRALRAALTPAEARLWTYLQGGDLRGRKFRRQHSVGPYIVDFCCAREKLAIELDGAAHDNDAANHRDEARTAYLERLGIRVLRIENRTVFEDPDAVVALIAQHFMGG